MEDNKKKKKSSAVQIFSDPATSIGMFNTMMGNGGMITEDVSEEKEQEKKVNYETFNKLFKELQSLVKNGKIDDIDREANIVAKLEEILPFENDEEHNKWVDIMSSYEIFDDFKDATLKIANRLKECKLKEVYNTEDRIRELKQIRKQRPLTDDEYEELAYCENEVSSREAEKKYLNGENESLQEDTQTKKYVWKKDGDDHILTEKGKDKALITLSRMNSGFPWTIYKGNKEIFVDANSDKLADIKDYILKNIDTILGKKTKDLKEGINYNKLLQETKEKLSIDKVKEVVDKYDNSVYLEDEGYVSCANRKEMLAIAKELGVDDSHYGGNFANGYFVDIKDITDLNESSLMETDDVQSYFDKERAKELFEKDKELTPEYVLNYPYEAYLRDTPNLTIDEFDYQWLQEYIKTKVENNTKKYLNSLFNENLKESRHTYKDCDGDIQVYNDWGVEYIETYKEKAVIVKDENRDRYTIWSTQSNRPLSKYNRDNSLEPIWFNSVDEVKKYINDREINEDLQEGYYDELTVSELKEILNGVLDKLNQMDDDELIKLEPNTYRIGNPYISLASRGFVDLASLEDRSQTYYYVEVDDDYYDSYKTKEDAIEMAKDLKGKDPELNVVVFKDINDGYTSEEIWENGEEVVSW